jgi:hypothetical protein
MKMLFFLTAGWGGGGLAHKEGERCSGLNDKPDIDGQLYPTIPYISQVFKINFGQDSMNNLRKRVSGDKVIAW